MTPEQSKAKASADAKARAMAKAANGTESQVNNAAPLIYRAPQINVPSDPHEFAALIQRELTKIEQSQSVLLTLLEGAPVGAVSTVNGEAPDAAGNIALSAGDVGAYPQTGGTLDGNMTINAPVNPFLALATAGVPGARLLQEAGGSLRLINDSSGHLLDLAPEGYMSYGGVIKSFDRKGVRQDGPATGFAGGSSVEAFPITMSGNDGDSAFHTRGVIDGQYHFAQWVLMFGGNVVAAELRSDGKLYVNGYPISLRDSTTAEINMNIALLRQEIKQEIYAELMAAGSITTYPEPFDYRHE